MFLAALLLAVVQAGTEFVPVSSSGHLFLFNSLLGDNADPFLVAAHLHGFTALSAVVYYRREFRATVRGLWEGGDARVFVSRYAGAQAVTLLVAGALVALLASTPASQWLTSGRVVGSLMLCNAVVLLAAPRASGEAPPDELPPLSWPMAFWVGLAQGIAALPGLSRSGLTVVVGLRLGLSPAHAASLSFLLAPPVIILAAAYWTLQGWADVSVWFVSWRTVGLAAFISAFTFCVGLLALHWVASWARSGRIRWFAPWSAAVGVAAILAAVW